jgi:hypothetical protein
MNARWWLRLGIGFWLMLAFSTVRLSDGVWAQQTGLTEAIQAVVRIRGCNVAGCNVGLGSGVIVHHIGVILTANHVTLTDQNNPLSPHLNDFVIEVSENTRLAPQARYRARLLAAQPETDLALLGIYWDEVTDRPIDEEAAVKLPALASADMDTIDVGERLHILGYPLAGGSAINYSAAALGGFDENGALMKIQTSLSEGNSGGPVLVERNGRYEIAGIVIRGRGARLEVGVIRSIDQLHSLIWEPTARRVWADNVQVVAQGQGADASLHIRMDIHALDYAQRNGRLLAYVFDAQTRQPWPSGDDTLPRNAGGQTVLRADFSASRTVDTLSGVTIMIPLDALRAQPDQLAFRLLLWDTDEARALWRDEEWRQPQAGVAEVAAAPTSAPALTEIPSATDTPTSTATQTETATVTPTDPPTPDLAAAQTAEAAKFAVTVAAAPTAIARLSVTSTPTSEPQPLSLGAVTLLAPADGDTLNSRLVFQWAGDFDLPSDYAFEPVFWKRGQDPLRDGRGFGGSTRNLHLSISLDSVFASGGQQGEYFWGIRLIGTDPFQPVALISEHRRIVVVSPGSDDGRVMNPTSCPTDSC